jgi:4-hydroxythreonine-4-phosphate dehydrogenase
MGDPAGVGPELCLRALADAGVRQACLPILFGDLGVAREVGRRLDLPVPETVIDAQGLDALDPSAGAAMVDLASLPPGSVEPGTVQRACGAAAFRAIEAAIGAAMAGDVVGVVTAPINKEALHLAGVPHPGHTEIFTALTMARRSCMLLCDDAISCSFVTTHTAIAQVSGRLSVQRILDVIELTADALQRLRGRPARIGVCGLNPHAGEHGLFGDEEARAIEPAMAEARSRGIQVEGPFPPDAAFLPKLRERIDATVCMYHDQGHIPFKMLAFDSGVNITLGLPIVRTSVDHGTAFDIAWQGTASPSSLLAAIRCAVRLAP